MNENTKRYLEYCPSTESIILKPNGYKLAQRVNGKWVCDADRAFPVKIVMYTFQKIFTDHEVCWGNPINLLNYLNEQLDIDFLYVQDLGMRAAKYGKDTSSCPYKVNSEKANIWMDGFISYGKDSGEIKPYQSFIATGLGAFSDLGFEVSEINKNMMIAVGELPKGGCPILITRSQAKEFFNFS